MENRQFRVIYDQMGQLCNRFWSYIASIQWAIQHQKNVFVVFWDPQIVYYNNLRHNNYIHFPFYNRLWDFEILSRYPFRSLIMRIFDSPKFKQFASSPKGKNLGFMQGWKSESVDECKELWNNPEIMEQIRYIFKPNSDITEKVECLFNSRFDRKSEAIVGVHLRRGDYKTFLGGQFYYSDDVYMRMMLHIQKLFSQKVRFFCATNEALSSTIIEQFDPLIITDANAAEDLYSLSICDYIIGPPSTFSQWASFYGRVPLFVIETPDSLPSIDDFSCVYALDYFMNGHVCCTHYM